MKWLLHYFSSASLFYCWLTLQLLTAPGHAREGDFLSVNGPCELMFPRDHGAHPGYRNEWWYYTGNLATPSGERYGFQLTFFRTQISPPGAEKDWPPNPSAWRTKQLFFAHAAFSDLENGRFYHDEKMARGALGLAGAEQREEITRVFLGTWSALLGPEEHRLQVSNGKFAFELFLRPTKPPAAHGLRGYSLKGKKPDSASCYYSFTRLETSGTLTINGKPITVRGTAWMDHEFSSAPLEADLSGWDWFSVQLANNTELMIYLIRNRRGGYSPSSSGTLVRSSGKTLHLSKKDFRVEVLDKWESPRSGALYPSRWRIRVFPIQLDLRVVPNLADQELITERTTNVTYWEGSVSVSGSLNEKAIAGVGYVEMTGYAKPFNLLQ